jgi:glycerophosphoryl diester phosphodiesterase
MFVAVAVMACSHGANGPDELEPPLVGPCVAKPAQLSKASRWNTASTPVVIGHRGSLNIAAPENTYAAFDYAASIHAGIETDMWMTADGVLVLVHDPTVDRTTGSSGSVTSMTLSQVAALDGSYIYRPDIFSPQRIPTFETYLSRYGSELLLPEVKGPATDGIAAAQLIRRMGLQHQTMVQSFFPEALCRVQEVDPEIATAITSMQRVDPADAVAYGVSAALIEYRQVDAAYVDALHSKGVKVIVWTIDSLPVAEVMAAIGVDGIISDDPALIQEMNRFTPRGTTAIPIAEKLVGPGWRAYASTPGWVPAAEAGVATFAGINSVPDVAFSRLQLPFLRVAPDVTPVTLDVTINVVAMPTSGNTTRQIGLRFCWSTDGDYNYLGTTGTAGDYFGYNLNGHVELGRSLDGKRSPLATATWPLLSAGQRVPLHVEVVGSQIAIRRNDTQDRITALDPGHPCPGFVSVYGAGVVPGVGSATLTY